MFSTGSCCEQLHTDLFFVEAHLTLDLFLMCIFNVCLCSANGTINTISGSAMSKDPFEPAKLLVTFFEGKILTFSMY